MTFSSSHFLPFSFSYISVKTSKMMIVNFVHGFVFHLLEITFIFFFFCWYLRRARVTLRKSRNHIEAKIKNTENQREEIRKLVGSLMAMWLFFGIRKWWSSYVHILKGQRTTKYIWEIGVHVCLVFSWTQNRISYFMVLFEVDFTRLKANITITSKLWFVNESKSTECHSKMFFFILFFYFGLRYFMFTVGA